MASDAPLRYARLPSPQQVIGLIEGDFTRAGYDVEDVEVIATTSPPRIVIVADGDAAPDLDAIAALSRTASERLDEADRAGGAHPFDPYVLEVTSPGIERPLTAERHFRRARGRRAELTMADGSTQRVRIGELVDGHLRVVVAGTTPGQFSVRDLTFDDISEAVVQVEFSSPSRRELELAGVSEPEAEEDA